jgi:hypothetical protein
MIVKRLVLLLAVQLSFIYPEFLAEITAIKGSIKIQKSTGSLWQKGFTGMKIYQNDRIRTEYGCSAYIKTAVGAELKIEENTFAMFKTLYKSRGGEIADIILWSGLVYANVPKMRSPQSLFRIITPSITAEIKGTIFLAGVKDGIGRIASYIQNAPGSIIVFTSDSPENRHELTPGMAISSIEGEKHKILTEETALTLEEVAQFHVNTQAVNDLRNDPPPFLKLTSLKEKIIKDDIVLVTGKTKPGSEINIRIDGVEMYSQIIHKKDFSIPINVSSRFGDNVRIQVSAIDELGRRSVFSRVYSILKKPLKLEIESPVNDSFELSEDFLNVKGIFEKGAKIAVLLNEKIISKETCKADGSFDIDLNVIPYLEKIKKDVSVKFAVLTESDGRKTRIDKLLTYKTPEIPVILQEPKGDVFIHHKMLSVAGRTEPGSVVTIYINNEPQEELSSDETGKFNTEIDVRNYINLGPIRMDILVQSDSGKKSTRVVRYIRYLLRAVISDFKIENMPEGTTIVNKKNISLIGVVKPSDAELTINEKSVKVTDGIFTKNIMLKEGLNDFVAELSFNKQIVSKTLSVTLDSVAPKLKNIKILDKELVSYSPQDGDVSSDVITVLANTSRDVQRLMVDDKAMEFISKGSFKTELPFTAEKAHTPVFILVDDAGNKTVVNGPELKKVYKPDISILQFNNGKVYFKVGKNNLLTVKINGESYLKDELITSDEVQIDLKSFSATEKFLLEAYCQDKYGRRSPVLKKTFSVDYRKPELISSDITVFGTYYIVETTWSEQCEVHYFPNGYGTEPELVVVSDENGNAKFTVSFDTLISEGRNIYKVQGMGGRLIFGIDNTGNYSRWYGSTDYEVVK